MKLFDFSLKLKGFPIKEAKALLKTIQNKDEAAFESYLKTQKQDIVAFHLTNNPFYKKLVENTFNDDWNSLPVITKKDLQQPLKNRLSKGFHLNNVYVNKTSGSTGDPFYFAKDKSF